MGLEKTRCRRCHDRRTHHSLGSRVGCGAEEESLKQVSIGCLFGA